MDEYNINYARPLEKVNIHKLKSSLYQWRNHLREEIEGLVYLKRGLKSNNIESILKSKLTEISIKLENFIMKEIENLSELIFEIEKKMILEIDDNLYKKYELMRDNFNKILLNIQKLVASSPDLIDWREKYENSKLSYNQMMKSMELKSFKMKSNIYNAQSNPNEWLDKIINDIDTIQPSPNKTSNKDYNTLDQANKSANQIDRDLAKLESNFYKSIKSAKYNTLKNNGNLSNHRSNFKTKKNTVQSCQKDHIDKTFNSNTIDNKTIIGYEQIKGVTKELQHVKNYCKELKSSFEENCIMYNEKDSFNKMRQDFIKLNADMGILKQDISELLQANQDMIKRVSIIEEENNSLRKHNKKLIKFFQASRYQAEPQEESYASDGYSNFYKNQKFSQYDNIYNQEELYPLSEMSALNSRHNTSSIEMINNINKRIDSTNHRGKLFLIPKPDDD